jgi:hypothetical protein
MTGPDPTHAPTPTPARSPARPRRRWRDLSPWQQCGIVVAAAVQLSLAAAALDDLIRRPAEQVNGSKRLWALVIGINFIGPLAYFRWGRRPAAQH